MAGTGQTHLREGSHLEVRELVVEFDGPKKSTVHAVSGISFDIAAGETLGAATRRLEGSRPGVRVLLTPAGTDAPGEDWQVTRADGSLWTDDYSDLLGTLRW